MPTFLSRSKTKILLEAAVQYDIDYGHQYGRCRLSSTQKRWPAWTPAGILYVPLEFCEAFDVSMYITIEILYERGRSLYVHFWKLMWTPKINVVWVLKVSGKVGAIILFTGVHEQKHGSLWMSILGRRISGRRPCSAHHGSDAWSTVGLTCSRKAGFCDCINGKLLQCNWYESFWYVTFMHTHQLNLFYSITGTAKQRNETNRTNFRFCYKIFYICQVTTQWITFLRWNKVEWFSLKTTRLRLETSWALVFSVFAGSLGKKNVFLSLCTDRQKFKRLYRWKNVFL